MGESDRGSSVYSQRSKASPVSGGVCFKVGMRHVVLHSVGVYH